MRRCRDLRSGSVSLSDVRLQGLLDRPELTHCGKRCEFRDCKVDGITRSCLLSTSHSFQDPSAVPYDAS
ncbi:uncharacterized protein ARMOST_21512 [Armillaria ostoyae]|uniref:Uncharacterized protein n=1 Tax=Armillaria ostoyae TaxID=47428 RepID=A0A284SAB6_ARMOS|nr:uncharacterized protein ARMOST_21512 [Armillaria ostoyae]